MTCSVIITRGNNKGNACGKKEFREGMCRVHYRPEIEENGCGFVLTRGTRKGKVCGKKIKGEEEFCTTHSKNVNVKKCVFVLIRGTRKGQTCDKKCKDGDYCSSHLKVVNPEVVAEECLPEVIITKGYCPYISKRGKTKGFVCNNKLRHGNELCMKHASKTKNSEAESETESTKGNCCYVAKKGKSKGVSCNGKTKNGNEFCSKHMKTSKPEVVAEPEVEDGEIQE